MFVSNLGYVLLFVKDPLESGRFYERLLGISPVEAAPTFVLFVLGNGVKLGLWSRETAEPKVTAQAGGSEICFSEDNVDQLYEHWSKLGVAMAQVPTDMDFGYTFVALDPDGHRIRVFRLKEQR